MFIGELVGIIRLITTTVDTIHIIIRITAVMVQQPGTIRLQEHLDEVVGLMDHMVVLVTVHVTIHQQEHMRVAQLHMDLMARVVMQKHTILEPELPQELDKEATIMASWGSSAVRRGDDWVKSGHYRGQEGGGMRYRTSDGNSGFVGRKGDDLYAGRDGNVYVAPIVVGKAGTMAVGIM